MNDQPTRTIQPEGWSAFGTYVGGPGEPLVFSYEIDESGMPLWERPGDLRQELGDLVAKWESDADIASQAAMDDMSVATMACVRELRLLLGMA